MIRVAILFGGSSREREVSFSGGRTVFDNLDKNRFQAMPVFVDSFNRLVELDWQYIYKGSIRDFYPPVSCIPDSEHGYQVYAESLTERLQSGELSEEDLVSGIGKPLSFEALKEKADLVFLALHGAYAEDGTIQGLLEWYRIPYTGSGIFASSFGINKHIQKRLLAGMGFSSPEWSSLSRQEWINEKAACIRRIQEKGRVPLVVKAANQGSSIGISVLSELSESAIASAVDRAFFRVVLTSGAWLEKNETDRVEEVRKLSDIREGLGLPLLLNGQPVYYPEQLLAELNGQALSGGELLLEALDGESEVILEEFIEGREFSCIVIQGLSGQAIALPPTEIVKGTELFDYKSKYLPGLSRKLTPIDLPAGEIERIREACVSLFRTFDFNVYARIDGFYGKNGEIFLNDPNTTSGMMPSSFFFHQAAEIGLNPSAFLSYIIETSLRERVRTSSRPAAYQSLLDRLGNHSQLQKAGTKKKIAVIMGGYSSERHISVESGRNIFEKLSSSVKYLPVPVFLTGNDRSFSLYQLPVNIMLKDNADDILQKVLHFKRHPAVQAIVEECAEITGRYADPSQVLEPRQLSFDELAQLADGVFIALHGRPGEDGALQKELEVRGLAYNGSGVESSGITINKYLTGRILEANGFSVARSVLVEKKNWEENNSALLEKIEKTCRYPLIAKPADDGCSSAVKKIDTPEELRIFAEMMFRTVPALPADAIHTLKIEPSEEIPMKDFFVVEELISRNGAAHFLEITGGLLTHFDEQGKRSYEIFEASEALAEKGILSLAEKFLAGQGQNITPARYARDPAERQRISDEVKKVLEAAAHVLDIEGYARIDAFVRIFGNGSVEVIFIEVNSLPGMTPATCIFHQTAINGYTPYEFIDRILEYGFRKQKNRANI
jgi:UDP-N-acetylmuramate--alanine ligase